ncbi:hypothetical protein VOI54_03685 [Tamlana sp. 2201CG12-4]|uniref:hypothetical protein n=1 Tax=Tamlana sp. 2201CG12-4 TaxID=3112582 RepID=UPI002DC018E7|nr:hypothetical protein [Tamlana sp. 2201CG12-4]MEC3906104.1 hypothetical protein [Tamlana sp. 2201CG12-4]
MMRFSTISFVFILLFVSCGIPTIKGLPEQSLTITEFTNPYFSNGDIDYVYKAKINAYGNTFGGILIIKKIKDSNHRIVFTTNFGNKIFDFELTNNDIKVHYIMENLNRKIIIKTLKNDFTTLTQEHNKIDKAFKKGERYTVYQSKLKNRYNHFFIDKESRMLQKIVLTNKVKEITTFKFKGLKENTVGEIFIKHNSIALRIGLQKL